jgi:hypothetical protein
MWKRRRLFFVGGGLLLVVVCVQLLYPYETAMPFARAFGQSVGFKHHNDIAAQLQTAFEQVSIELKSPDRTATTSLSKLGAELNTERMTLVLTDYPLWQRLIPLSILAKQPRLENLDVSMSGVKMQEITGVLAAQLSYAPTDASFTLKDGKLMTVKAQSGTTVTAAQVRDSLITTAYSPQKTIVGIKGTTILPARNDSGIEQAKRQAMEALNRNVVLTVTGKGAFTPDAATKASWLVIKNTDTSTDLSVDKEAVSRYVSTINDKVKTGSTPTVVTLVDGNESARTEGKNGEALDIDDLTAQMADALIGETPATLATALKPVAPGIRYDRSYSNTQDGLRAYVAYATSTQNVRIVVQQLDGQGWSASGRSGESIPSASTYKLYVMMRVFDEINSGKLSWDTPMLDTTAGGCFERTIVPSTNPCAEEWIRQFGRDTLNKYVHDKGFSSGTGFTFSDATHTTAGDLAKYLIGLNNGSLVSGNNRDMLLEKMSRQLYRYGIPTGVNATRVEDKVGFLWDYIHDAAIVHKPQGTYILVIMTKGYSYGYIANVARQIDTIMYP